MPRHYHRYTDDEKFALVTECRKSGISDQQWCAEHQISTSCFYRWIKSLREKACQNLPEKQTPGALQQDVVKLEIVPDSESIKRECFTPTKTAQSEERYYFTPTVSLEKNGTLLCMSNDADPLLISSLLRIMGELK